MDAFQPRARLPRVLRAGVLAFAPLLAGCALFSAPAPSPAPAAPPATITWSLDFGALFGSHATSSLFDLRVIQPGQMARVYVDPPLLTPEVSDSGVELWTQRRLLARLGSRGSVIVVAPPAGMAASVPPTVALRDVAFVSGHDRFDVVVARGDADLLHIELRAAPDDDSLCSSDLALELGFVQLLATVVALPGGEVAALLHEVALVPAMGDTTVVADLPDGGIDPAGFCAGIARAFDASEALRRKDDLFELAAESVLAAGIDPLYVTAPQGPALGPDDPLPDSADPR